MRASVVVAGVAACMATAPGCHMGFLGLVFGVDTGPPPYIGETLASELGRASVRTLGCVDIGLAPMDRAGATLAERGELVDIHLGNRCSHPEVVDLTRLRIRGRDADADADADGAEHEIGLYDPHNEIVPLHIGGAERGVERVRLSVDPNLHLGRLMFMLDGVAPGAPTATATPLCFEHKAGAWSAKECAPS
jgi:hypothetical protein